jgi:predicted glycosyltransferase
LISDLSSYGKIFITSERRLPSEFEPYRISIPPHELHDALYYATMCIGDSSTVVEEAAVLGTPAIYCSTLAGRFSILQELEHKYGLSYQMSPKNDDKIIDKITELLNRPNLKKEWQEKRERMLKEKIDLTEWMVDFVENYPESFKERKRVHRSL